MGAAEKIKEISSKKCRGLQALWLRSAANSYRTPPWARILLPGYTREEQRTACGPGRGESSSRTGGGQRDLKNHFRGLLSVLRPIPETSGGPSVEVAAPAEPLPGPPPRDTSFPALSRGPPAHWPWAGYSVKHPWIQDTFLQRIPLTFQLLLL